MGGAAQDGAGALINTLQDVDSLDGGAGVDTLNATVADAGAAAAIIAPTLKNIENIDVRFVGTKANDLNLVGATGVQSITVANSTNGTGIVSNVGAVANLAVKNQNVGVDFQGNTASTLNFTFDTVGKNTTAAEEVAVKAATGATAATFSLNKANVDLNTVATIQTLTVAATGANRLDLTASAGAIKTATVTGAGSVDLDAAFTVLTSLDASANTGGVTATVATTAVTVNGGAGADKVAYTAAIGATAKVNLGAGDDVLTIAAASAKGAVVNGGDGNDTLKVTNGAWLNADAKAIYSNFETLEIGGGTGAYDMDNLPGLTAVTLSETALAAAATISNAAAGTTLAVNAKASTDLAAGDLTYALKTATGTTDAVTLTLNAKDGNNNATVEGQVTLAAFKANDIETINIASNVTGIDNGKTNVDYANTITALTADAATTLNVTGNAGLTVTTLTATKLTKVDASAATGKVSVDASGAAQAVEFLGGSANDTFTGTTFGGTIAAGKGADTITLGATTGGVDTLIFSAGDSVLNGKANGHDIITNFGTTAGGGALDIIDLGAFGFSGQQVSALANKGALAASVVNGTTLTQADFFLSGGVARGAAIGTESGNTYVFVDLDKDGSFNAANDLFIQLSGVTDLSLGNFGF